MKVRWLGAIACWALVVASSPQAQQQPPQAQPQPQTQAQSPSQVQVSNTNPMSLNHLMGPDVDSQGPPGTGRDIDQNMLGRLNRRS